MKNILKTYPVVSILTFICLFLGILTSIYGNAMYDLLAFHSKPVYYWQYMSGTLMHGSKGAPLWFFMGTSIFKWAHDSTFWRTAGKEKRLQACLACFSDCDSHLFYRLSLLNTGAKNSGDGDFCGWLCFYNWRSHTFTEYLERIFMQRKTVLSFLNPSS